MKTPKSIVSKPDPKMKKKGGRPKKIKGMVTGGGTVSEKKITQPNTSREYRLTSRGEVSRILYDGRR